MMMRRKQQHRPSSCNRPGTTPPPLLEIQITTTPAASPNSNIPRRKRAPKMSLSPGNNRNRKKVSKNSMDDRLLAPLSEGQLSVLVYDPPVNDVVTIAKIKNLPGRHQGIWQGKYNANTVPAPQEIWIFPNSINPFERLNMKGHIHGTWGYKPGVLLRDGGDKNKVEGEVPKRHFLQSNLKPEELWVFSPSTTTFPDYFTPQGIWTFPLVRADVGQIPEDQSGFLKVGESIKSNKLDVAGSWKMLYKRSGTEGDDVKGPGILPRSPKPEKKITIHVEGPDGTIYKLDGLKQNVDTVQSIKEELALQCGAPTKQQILFMPGSKDEPLDDPNQTLRDAGIKHNMILQLDIPTTMTVYIEIESPDGDMFNIPLENVQPETTIEELQNMLEQESELRPDEDYDELEYNGEILNTEGFLTLQDYNIPDQAVIKAIQPEEEDDEEDEEGEKWAIIVQTTSGKQFPLEVHPVDSLLSVKEQVQKETSVDPNDQHLLYNDESLHKSLHSNTLEELEIPNGAILHLEGMVIFVQDADDNLFELDVEPTTTIQQIKSKLHEEQGLLPEQQRLSYNDAMLDEDENDDGGNPPTLYDYDIPHKAVLFLEPMQITVLNVRDNTTIALAADPIDTIGDIKDMVYVAEGIPNNEQNLTFRDKVLGDETSLKENGIGHGAVIRMEGMQIYIRDDTKPENTKESSTPTTYLVDVDYSDTIEDVKTKLEEQQNIPEAQQHLVFDNATELDDRATLRDLEIKHHQTLVLIPMQINVRTLQGKILKFIVQPSDKMKHIMKLIETETGVPKSDQRLFFGDQKLDDAYKLFSYGIVHGSTIDMVGMQVLVQDVDGETFLLDVRPSTPIETVKALIEDTTGIAPDDQRLFFKDVKLEDDEGQCLRDYKVKHKSLLELKPMEIHVKTPDEDMVLTLCVDPYDTIVSIKERIEDEEGIPVEHQELLLEDNALEDEPTLAAYGITHGTILEMDGSSNSMMEINIKDWSGKIFSLEVSPDETIEEVKYQIEDKEGIPASNQYLLYHKDLLDDDSKTLDDYDIQNKSTLHLDRMKIVVETPRGKFLMETDPTTTIDQVKNRVNEKVGIPQDEQAVLLPGEDSADELDGPMTLLDAGIEYRDSVHIREKEETAATTTPPESPERPTYSVKVGPWQSPFDYKPKPKIKRPKNGVRARKHYNQLSDFYATAVNTDTELNRWSTDEKEVK